MPNYQDGKIYSLRSHQTDDIYIGSTCRSLSARKANHKKDYKQKLNGVDINLSAFKICQFDDFYIELVENCPCNSREELHRREGEVIRNTPNCINKLIAGRGKKEHYEDNKERILEKNKEWAQNNQEKVKEYLKQYHQDNLEKHKQQNQQNYLDNRDKYKALMKENYQRNKVDQLAKQAVKYTCECGNTLAAGHKARHEKTKHHMSYMQQQNNN